MTRTRPILLAVGLLLAANFVGCSPRRTDGTVGTPLSGAVVPAFFAASSGQFLSADNGGGGAITATAPWMRGWEQFVIQDTSSSTLTDGDLVYVASSTGPFLSADGGGGGGLSATATAASGWEAFYLVRLAGPGAIHSGDSVALRTMLSGDYVSAINGGGGEVRADAPWAMGWETFVITLPGLPGGGGGAGGGGAGGGGGGGGESPRQRVLGYFASVSGHKTLAGQHDKHNASPTDATDQVTQLTGRAPALWSGDFLFGSDVAQRQTMINEAINEWHQGAVVQLMYHACIPTGDESCGWDDIGGANPQHLSDSQWTELVTDGTNLNAAWKARLDALSPFFQQLKSAGVAPLFRPIHEMNQGVFWWGGRGGANGTRKLYQITHDYLVNVKGFDNIIWVWDLQDFGSLSSDVSDYNPGPDYFDIAALDIYDGGYDQSKHDAIAGAAGGKFIAIGECSTPPTPGELANQPDWLFFMLWPDFIDQNQGALPGLYAAPNVITRDQMPGWSASAAPSPFEQILSRSQFESMFPNRNPFYTYDGLVQSTLIYPAFAASGTVDDRRREVAAFLANVNHETGALQYIDEIDKADYCGSGCPCAPGKQYYGRGPIQISWNSNYCAASQAIFGDPEVLRTDPDRVSRDPQVAWATGLWFWNATDCHNKIVNDQDFGGTIQIINGPVECGGLRPDEVQDRINAYLAFCQMLGVAPGPNLSC
jgi:predicted chitinase